MALVVLAGFGFLFVRSARESRSAPYTTERRFLSQWSVVLEPASAPTEPMLALRSPPELASDLFRQVFSRAMESLSSPSHAAIPLVLRGEFDRAFAGRVMPEALVAFARKAGLESATFEPRCLAYRRVSEPRDTRQVYFVLFDAPAVEQFRKDIVGLLEGAGALGAEYDPASISPVLIIAASETTLNRWLPLRADPETDCLAPIVVK